MKTQQARSFAVTPPSPHAWWILAMLLLLPAVGVLVAFYYKGNGQHAGQAAGAFVGLIVIALATVACVIGLQRRRVRLDGTTLAVSAGLFSRRVAVERIDLEHARIVNLDERTELRPMLKTFGMSLPGYQAGYFRLREKLGKAFCLLTDRRRVVWLPLRDSKEQFLLSLEQPQALLDALRSA